MSNPNKTYQTILLADFDALLKSDKGWVKDVQAGSNEFVFSYSLKNTPHIMIKVFSSINAKDCVSRVCGGDAIRVCAINTRTQRGIRKSSRINRIPGWNDRLKARICDMIVDLKKDYR